MRLDDILQDFLGEAEERFQVLETQLVTLERRPDDGAALDDVFRAAHSLKGVCGFLGFRRLGALAHAAEELLTQARDGQLRLTAPYIQSLLSVLDCMRIIVTEIEQSGCEAAEVSAREAQLLETLAAAVAGRAFVPPAAPPLLPAQDTPVLRVQSGIFDNLLALSGEIALAQERLGVETGSAARAHLAQLTRDLQAEVLRGRLQPVMEAWRSLPRLVRDLAAGAGLSVRLETEGSETLLDRQVLDAIRDPLSHLVRNCLSHGIEAPEERRAAGKPPEGVILLSARAAEGQVILTVADDGRGLDLDAIRSKALAAGIVTPAEAAQMSDEQTAALVFMRGFSTARQVDALAGRGVGLDAAAAKLASIGGALTVETVAAGSGAVFTMRLPLTLAMMPAVVIRTGAQRFVLPRNSIVRFCALPDKIMCAGGLPVFNWRGSHLPLLDLPAADETEQEKQDGSARFAAIVAAEGMTAALAIDSIEWTGDVIVKPLPAALAGSATYLGLTLLADGFPSMIVDVRKLIAGRSIAENPDMPNAQIAQPAERLLVFDADGRCAVPVSSVDCIRRCTAADFYTSAKRGRYYACDGKMLPLSVAGQAGDDAIFAIILRHEERRLCLPCRKIAGVIDVQTAEATAGVRVIERGAGEVLDVTGLFAQVFGEVEDTAAGRILLIDDSPFFCELLAPVLEQAGYRVDVAADAREALRLREAGTRFDLIISDIEMPDIDGLSFAREVRAEGSAWRKTPLLALSAHATRLDESRGRAAGFDAFITKFDRARLLGAISSLRHHA